MTKYILLVLAFFSSITLESKDIHLWHCFTGQSKDEFKKIVIDFNKSQSKWKVILKDFDNYITCAKNGLEAYNTKEGPHILQIFEVGALTMLRFPERYYPIYQLMKKYDKNFSDDQYLNVVRDFYSSPTQSSLHSFPWNASTGILFYNKAAFKKAGLDPENPPQTWPELEKCSYKLLEVGYHGFTTAWPAAYHLEHFSCWHNLPFATKDNGFGGSNARLVFNQPEQLFHLKKLVEWHEKGVFLYGGRVVGSEKLFTSGKCAILMYGANKYHLLQKTASFPIGVGKLPYWPHITPKPHNINIGGSSFWALKGHAEDDYAGVASFFAYLSKTEVQVKWHVSTGYLPISKKAYEYCKTKKDLYLSNPAAKIALEEVFNNPNPQARGVRLDNYIDIRNIIEEHLEKAFFKQEPPKQALDTAVEEGNALLNKSGKKLIPEYKD